MRASGRFHVGVAYKSFASVLQSISARALRDTPRTAGLASRDVTDRLLQRIVEIGLPDHLIATAARVSEETSTETRANLGGLCMDSDGSIRIPIRLAAREWLRFLGYWVQMLVPMLMGALPWRSAMRSVTLVYGVPHESVVRAGSDSRFAAFCRKGPIEPLARASLMFVEMLSPDREFRPDPRHRYYQYPLHRAIMYAGLGFSARLRMVMEHASMLLAAAAATIRFPLLALLAKDLAQLAGARGLERAGVIDAVVITNTLLSAQPLWMRGKRSFDVHLVWYSQNAIPLVYRWDELRSDHPHYPLIRVDTHWVWTKGFSDYLCSILPSPSVRIVGPLLWYLPEPAPTRQDARQVMTLFDVTPQLESYVRSQGILEYYYSRTNVKAFVEGALSLAGRLGNEGGRPFRVRIKHKRALGPLHDKEYGEWIERLESENRLERVTSDENLFSLIAGSDLVVVIPYSSPAYIADYLGVPSIFYDASGQLMPTFERGSRIGFASSVDEMCEQAAAMLTKREVGATSGIEKAYGGDS